MPDAATAKAVTATSSALRTDALFVKQDGQMALPLRGAGMLTALMPQAAPQPTVTLYASDCSTLRSTFSPGETVCAKVNGLNISLFQTHFEWVSASGAVLARSANITANGQSASFTLSANATLGKWRANITDQGGTIRAIGNFTVSDAANPATDLSLNDDGPFKVTAGNDVTYTVVLFNKGPDAAADVSLTINIPANTTFVSINQSRGSIFTCTGDTAATTCTIPLMPADDVAIFSVTYTVDSGTPANTIITSTASVTSATTDRNADDNSDSAETVTDSTPCVVSCPSNITVQADNGQAGAVVTYDAPTSTGDCAEGQPPVTVISCSQASGTFFPVGTTMVTCSGPSGDACHFTVTVDNPGALSISLNGPNPMTAECGSGFNGGGGFDDPGATAIDGNGDSVPVTITGTVNLGTTGSYTLTYTATEGVNSVSTTRTVNVVDTTKPTITIDGANPYNIQQGSCLAFIDPGASATDGCAGIVAVTRTISGPGGLTSVDNNTPGTYTITYSATDGSHPATAQRTVLVGNFPQDELDQPTTSGPPTITLNGDDQVTVECGLSFNDPGATASACGSSLPVTTSGTVDTHTPGVYTITYSATNEGGTAETHRTVTVEDTQAPVITLNGTNPLTVECHTAFTDPGATATDACSGSVPVTVSGSVNPNTPGTYTLTYSATDGSHPPTVVTRTVNVVDTQGPVITITGANPATVECHTSYSDAGATAFDACLNASVPVTTSGSVNVNVPGTYTITYTATDGARSSTATRSVVVGDTIAPVITLKTTPITFWPPNHAYRTINAADLVQSVNDSCGGSLSVNSVYIAKVTSDENENDDGDGNTVNDMVIAANCKSVQLRAERSGSGNGRVYSITVAVKDPSGNVGTAVFKVSVPKSQGNGGAAIDSGPHYTVNGNCP